MTNVFDWFSSQLLLVQQNKTKTFAHFIIYRMYALRVHPFTQSPSQRGRRDEDQQTTQHTPFNQPPEDQPAHLTYSAIQFALEPIERPLRWGKLKWKTSVTQHTFIPIDDASPHRTTYFFFSHHHPWLPTIGKRTRNGVRRKCQVCNQMRKNCKSFRDRQ